MRAVRFALGLGLMFLIIQDVCAVGPLAGMAFNYVKQRVMGEAQSRVSGAVMPEQTMVGMMGRIPGMDMANVPAEQRNAIQNLAKGPPPTKEQATQLVRDAAALGMLEPAQAEQMMQMFTSDSAPPQTRGMIFAVFKRAVAGLADMKTQMDALSPGDRKALAGDLAKEIGAMPKEQQDKMLHEFESGKIFPRGIADQVRASLRTAAMP